jgi:hypothetical protein
VAGKAKGGITKSQLCGLLGIEMRQLNWLINAGYIRPDITQYKTPRFSFALVDKIRNEVFPDLLARNLVPPEGVDPKSAPKPHLREVAAQAAATEAWRPPSATPSTGAVTSLPTPTPVSPAPPSPAPPLPPSPTAPPAPPPSFWQWAWQRRAYDARPQPPPTPYPYPWWYWYTPPPQPRRTCAPCAACSGRGVLADGRRCPVCLGLRFVYGTRQPCPTCSGRGFVMDRGRVSVCGTCRGVRSLVM